MQGRASLLCHSGDHCGFSYAEELRMVTGTSAILPESRSSGFSGIAHTLLQNLRIFLIK